MIKMKSEEVISTLENYKKELMGILVNYVDFTMRYEDESMYKQKIIEIKDFFDDILGENKYSREIDKTYIIGMNNYISSPSSSSVESVVSIISAAITRIKRNRNIIIKQNKEINDDTIKENVFIIHGKSEARWRELKDILEKEFKLTPIILSEKPDLGRTIIEKFEEYAKTCSCAIAIFTPDDEVVSNGEKYLQARPNVIYELGWFCGHIGRDKVILLLEEGTTIFSDFGGIVQKRFVKCVAEKTNEIRKDLEQMNILERK
jgi:predicted nucleotide-binding protein